MTRRRIAFWGMGAGVLAVAGFLGIAAWDLPDVAALRTHNPDSSAFMGFRRSQARRQGADFRPYQVWTPLAGFAPHLVHAVLIAEDDTFYRHRGFDLAQIWEAVRINWRKGRYAYGGSTITQQLARNLYLSPEKTLLRKAREAMIAWKLERALSKRRILELYMNLAEWGPGIYGGQAAARTYYAKDAADLTVDEAVFLACTLPSPRRYHPFAQTESLERRREDVLRRMREAGYLPAEPDQTAGPAGRPAPEAPRL